jgi:hypothetical protein
MRTSMHGRTTKLSLASVIALLALAGCGPKHHLDQYNFAGKRMALVVLAPPAPGLLEDRLRLRRSDELVEAVVQAGATVAKNAEAGRARARLDSATTRAGLADALARRTLDRASRYLGMRPVPSQDDADFLLEVHMRSFGIDARGSGAATLYTNAEAVLLDRHTGREIWNVRVRGTDRLTPPVRGSDRLPGTIITAGTLHTVTVADFQQALDQLVQLSSNVIADRLRSALRDAREK